MKIFLVLLVLFVLRDVIAWIFGWGSGETFTDLMDNAEHNRAIDRQWKKNGKPIISTTVGWRPDPFGKKDGYRDNGDCSYSTLLRGGTKEYREKFARDVEEGRK